MLNAAKHLSGGMSQRDSSATPRNDKLVPFSFAYFAPLREVFLSAGGVAGDPVGAVTDAGGLAERGGEVVAAGDAIGGNPGGF